MNAMCTVRRHGGSGCRGRWSGRCSRHPRHGVAGVPAPACRLLTQLVIECPPVARFGVLPRLVVSEGRLIAKRWRGCAPRRGFDSTGLAEREQGHAEHRRRQQPEKELVHCSRPCSSSARHRQARGLSRRPLGGRASPVRPPSEVLVGQMVRGGRSWPSDRKVGAGPAKSANLRAGRAAGSGSFGVSLTKGVSEQKAEHMLHLSTTPWS